MTPKVSVIIPVYNVEQYLPRCLDSVVNQTLKEIEIICVNDGSTDGSLAILQNYAEKDQRIKIIDKENEGQSVARNIAVKNAKGKFIAFVDSDDWLEINMCENLYTKASGENLDMLSFAAKSYIEDTQKYVNAPFYNFYYLKNISTSTDPQTLRSQFWWKMAPTCPLTFYNREFLFLNNIFFEEKLKFEDCLFFKQALFATNKIGITTEQLYFHRIHSESTVNNGEIHYLDWFVINEKIYDLIHNNAVDIQDIKKWFCSTIGYTMFLYKNIKREYKREFLKKSKAFYKKFQHLIYLPYLNSNQRKFIASLIISNGYLSFLMIQRLPLKIKPQKNIIRICGIKFRLKGFSCL